MNCRAGAGALAVLPRAAVADLDSLAAAWTRKVDHGQPLELDTTMSVASPIANEVVHVF